MKQRITLLTILLFAVLAVSAQSLVVGSFNMRYKNVDDSLNGDGWERRCPVICDMINFEQPDIFGTQELLNGPLHDVLNRLTDYNYVGVGRDNGKRKGEYSAIFYRKDKFKLLNQGNFWLSETPEKAGSKGWDAAKTRICSWGFFEVKSTPFRFWYFNLHMDHKGVVARRESAKLVIAKIKEMCKGAPVILTGDFNVDQHNEIYKIFTESGILKDSYVCAKHRFAENGTINTFHIDSITDSRIDHIFVTSGFNVNAYGVLTNCYFEEIPGSGESVGKDAPAEVKFKKYRRRLPSDHYPIMARLNYSLPVHTR